WKWVQRSMPSPSSRPSGRGYQKIEPDIATAVIALPGYRGSGLERH
ncbi:MAG: hypothetical protein ACI9HE_003626, partial [Planctomycetota bacterium]